MTMRTETILHDMDDREARIWEQVYVLTFNYVHNERTTHEIYAGPSAVKAANKAVTELRKAKS